MTLYFPFLNIFLGHVLRDIVERLRNFVGFLFGFGAGSAGRYHALEYSIGALEHVALYLSIPGMVKLAQYHMRNEIRRRTRQRSGRLRSSPQVTGRVLRGKLRMRVKFPRTAYRTPATAHRVSPNSSRQGQYAFVVDHALGRRSFMRAAWRAMRKDPRVKRVTVRAAESAAATITI